MRNYIFGFGDLGHQVAFLLNRSGLSLDGFIDDADFPNSISSGYSIFSFSSFLQYHSSLGPCNVFIAIADSRSRYNVFSRLSRYRGRIFLPR